MNRTAKRRLAYIAGLGICVLAVIGLIFFLPLDALMIHPKPDAGPQNVYDYYVIIDEETGSVLMYVPIVVHLGDELISEENKRYRIIRIEENRAIARFIRKVDLTEYERPRSP